MNNVIQFPNSDVKEYRQKCCFMNRAVQVEGEDGELQKLSLIHIWISAWSIMKHSVRW